MCIYAYTHITTHIHITTQLQQYDTQQEKHLLFRFRWSLTDQPGALTKASVMT